MLAWFSIARDANDANATRAAGPGASSVYMHPLTDVQQRKQIAGPGSSAAPALELD